MKVERRHLNKHSIHTSRRRHRMEELFHGSWLPGMFITRFLKTLDSTNQVRVAIGIIAGLL